MQQVVAEALALGIKAGVGLPAFLDSGSRGPAGALNDRLTTVFQGRFDSLVFTLRPSQKGHRTSDRPGPAEQGAYAGGEHGRADHAACHEPRLERERPGDSDPLAGGVFGNRDAGSSRFAIRYGTREWLPEAQ